MDKIKNQQELIQNLTDKYKQSPSDELKTQIWFENNKLTLFLAEQEAEQIVSKFNYINPEAVFILRYTPPEVSKHGLILPDGRPANWGKILKKSNLNLGEDHMLEKRNNLNVGDYACFQVANPISAGFPNKKIQLIAVGDCLFCMSEEIFFEKVLAND